MKTKKLLLALSTGFLLCSTQQKAQVSACTFTQNSSTYGAASNGTMVGAQFQDDDVNTVSLPFSFTYNGTSHTSLNLCANGFMSFNTLSGTEYTPISDNSTQNVLSPFGNDLFMGVIISADMTTGSNTLTNCSSVNGYSVGDVLLDYNNDFASSPVVITAISGNNIVLNTTALNTMTAYDVANSHGYIKQSVSGVAPNRICEFEYAHFCRYFIYDEDINFKVRLYETSNKIEFLYGVVTPGTDQTPCEIGLKGGSTDFNSRKVSTSGAWSNSSASTLISDACAFQTGVSPVSGQSYMWTPVACTVPVLAIASSNSVICAGETATLTASGATTYSWTNGPAAAQNTVMPAATTVYTLVGANTTCTSSLTFTQDVAANPTLTIVQSRTLICKGEAVTFTASGATSYTWNGASGTAQYTDMPTVTTTYSLTGSNGTCVATQSAVTRVSDCTGISEIANSFEGAGLSAYPNPFNITLNIRNTAGSALNISICDALGRLVYAGSIPSDSVQSISGESLKSGLYFITVKNESGSFTKKLIRE